MSGALQGDQAAGVRHRRLRLHLQHLQRGHPQVGLGRRGPLQRAELANSSVRCARSGVITNAGGKVIVKKMAGQSIYKGSNSNGVRSLSLPKWRESFVVSGSGAGGVNARLAAA